MASTTNGTQGPRTAALKIDTTGHQGRQQASPAQTVSPTRRSATFFNLERHAKYYIATGDLHLLAGNVLFKVHSYFFERESQMFRDRLGTVTSPTFGTSRLGSEDSSALVLEESPENFEKFLEIFYNPTFSLYAFSIPDWTIILGQAHRWGFEKVKELVVREMEKLTHPAVERLALYERFEVDPEITVPLYASLTLRSEPLSVEEGQILGIKTTAWVFQVREKVRAVLAKRGHTEPPVPFTEEAQLHQSIRKLLGIAKKGDERKINGVNGTSSSGKVTNGSP